MDDKGLLRNLERLPKGARRDLLRVLLANSDVRADLIRQFYERKDTRGLAEVLIDLERTTSFGSP